MPKTIAEIAAEARELSPEDREILALTISDDLSPEERDRVDRLWSAEIERRHEARMSGRSRSYSLEETIAAVRGKLSALRPR